MQTIQIEEQSRTNRSLMFIGYCDNKYKCFSIEGNSVDGALARLLLHVEDIKEFCHTWLHPASSWAPAERGR